MCLNLTLGSWHAENSGHQLMKVRQQGEAKQKGTPRNDKRPPDSKGSFLKETKEETMQWHKETRKRRGAGLDNENRTELSEVTNPRVTLGTWGPKEVRAGHPGSGLFCH